MGMTIKYKAAFAFQGSGFISIFYSIRFNVFDDAIYHKTLARNSGSVPVTTAIRIKTAPTQMKVTKLTHIITVRCAG
jgi:hypothetical protein